MNKELPSIGSSTYATSAVGMFDASGLGLVADPAHGVIVPRRMQVKTTDAFVDAVRELQQQRKEDQMAAPTTRRLVQVIVADPDPKLPLDKALMYKGAEQFTDLTNEELFYELDIKGILAKHNEQRVTVVDKTVKDRTEMLEPARVRDLKMVVVEIAKF